MVYKINVPLVGGGTRKKEIIDSNRNLTVDEIRVGSIAQKSHMMGSTRGYSSGSASPNSGSNVIDKFPFASDANATDVGDLTQSRSELAGQSSSTHGYSSGGVGSPFANKYDTIDKFSLVATANATDVGDLSTARYSLAGQSSTSNGYVSGGINPPTEPPTYVKKIEKFPFSSDANTTFVGDLTENRDELSGQSSSTHGYSCGGPPSPVVGNIIDKFSFSSDGNATDVGDLTVNRANTGGNSSSDNGYASGGFAPPPSTGFKNVIDKFPFSSDGNATDVGDLTVARNSLSEGQNSTSNGYMSGGFAPSIPGTANIIEKFPFGSDANATDVGDLTVNKSYAAGQQV